MFLDTPKHLVAADLRQIPVQQDEIGQQCVCPFFVEQYFQGVFAILCDHNIPPDFAAIPKGSLDEVQVWFTVLYYKKKIALGTAGAFTIDTDRPRGAVPSRPAPVWGVRCK